MGGQEYIDSYSREEAPQLHTDLAVVEERPLEVSWLCPLGGTLCHLNLQLFRLSFYFDSELF